MHVLDEVYSQKPDLQLVHAALVVHYVQVSEHAEHDGVAPVVRKYPISHEEHFEESHVTQFPLHFLHLLSVESK